VVKHEGRDPRLLWHAPTKRWVMALYNEHAGKRWITFHTSPDLKTWTFTSRIEGFYECPDLFELPIDGDAKNTRWVLTGASSEYMIGAFDGREFHPETPKLPGHRGEAFYAAQTFTNEPRGRIVQIGWGQIKTPGMPFNQMMCFPTELALRTTSAGVRLCWQPVQEIETLRARSRVLAPGETLVAEKSPELIEVRAEFAPGGAREVGFDVRGLAIRYDPAKQELVAKNHRVPLPLADGKLRLTLLVDRTSLELFANDGSVYVPLALPLDGREKPVRVVAGAEAQSAIEVHELRSIWEGPKPAN
jgi:fructan beta-fructosidase